VIYPRTGVAGTGARILLACAVLACALAVRPAHATNNHVVKPGESLSQIADDLGVTPEALAAANDIVDPNHIVVGQVLEVPSGAAVAATAAAQSYTVQAGDTLSAIALRAGISTDVLASANALVDPNHIVEGTVLTVPAAIPLTSPAVQTYTVAPGDTLSGIADRLGLTPGGIAAINGISDLGLIIPGQVLRLPAGGTPVAVATPAEARQAIRNAAAEFGIDPSLLLAIAWQESGFQQHVISSSGAVGIMQLLPSTATWAVEFLLSGGRAWQYNPVDNARVGAAVFRDLLDKSGGDVELAIGSYYQGWGSIHRLGWFDETRAYVANVLALANQFN
jgi:LysM repeat protein